MMHIFDEFVSGIDHPTQQERLKEIFQWIEDTFPQLEPRIAWNQPMYTDHGTFIIGFSVAKHHISVAPERKGINHFSAEIIQAGYDHGKNMFRIKESLPIDYPLLKKIVEFNIKDKADCSTFWRK